jgi:hypothetical protein
VLNGLRQLSPNHRFSQTEIIDFTQLTWLPGPEGAMRFWASAEAEAGRKTKWERTPTGVTVFLGNADGEDGGGGDGTWRAGHGYRCPAWAESKRRVVWAKRQEGRGGLVARERTDAVIEGIRGIAGEVLKLDGRLASTIAGLEVDTVIEEGEDEGEGDMPGAGAGNGEGEQSELRIDIGSPQTATY